MLISDYDNTFYINDNDIKKNVQFINKFIEKNFFVIATGRSYISIQKEIKKYNIPYHYLIINHGASILKNNKIIYNISIDNSIKNQMVKELELEKSIYYLCNSGIHSTSIVDKNITRIHVEYKSEAEAKRINDILLSKYSNYIRTFLVDKNKSIEIVSWNVDKANAINYIAKIEEITQNQIYTIGDNYTDIEMIKSFQGYAVKNSISELKKFALNEYSSVSDLIREIIE